MNELELDAMVLRLMGDGSSYTKMMVDAANVTERARGSIEAAAGRIIGIGGTLRSFASTAAQALGAMGIGLSLFGSIFKGVNLAAQAEENQVAFEVMLKSAERGKQMLEDLTQFAAKIPLNLPDIQRATKTLLQFGSGGEDIIPTLKMLGDVTGGNAERFNRMAYAFGQMQSSGRLMGQDLLQMINAGFNPLSEIAKTSGKSMSVLKQEMEAGKITVDMVKNAFKSATSEGGTFFNQMEKQSKTISGLFSTMQDDIGAFLRTMGQDIVELLKLKDVMGAVSSAAQKATEWLKSVSEETKRWAAAIGSAVAVLMTFGLAWEVLGGVIMSAVAPVLTVVSVLLSPLGAVILGIAAATKVWIDSVGGLGKAWEATKAAALAAWEWVQPILTVLKSFFGAVYEIGAAMFQKLGEVIRDVWRKVVGDTEVNWESIRVAIMNAILFAEFSIRNFDQVASLVWASFKLQVGVFVDNFINGLGVIESAFTATFDAAQVGFDAWVENFIAGLMVAGSNVKAFASGAWSAIKAAFSGENPLEAFQANFQTTLQDAMSRMNIGGRDMGGEMANAFQESFNKSMSGRNLGDSDLTAQWRKEFDAQADQMGKSFEQFRQQKMTELFPPEQEAKTKDAAKRVGYEAGQAMSQGPKAAIKAIQDFDAALRFSAEAISRISEFRERIKTKNATTGASSAVAPFVAARSGSAEAGSRVDKNTDLLSQIRDAVVTTAKKPSLDIETGAGLA